MSFAKSSPCIRSRCDWAKGGGAAVNQRPAANHKRPRSNKARKGLGHPGNLDATSNAEIRAAPTRAFPICGAIRHTTPPWSLSHRRLTASNENSLGVHSIGRVFLERRKIVAEPRLSQGPDAPILFEKYSLISEISGGLMRSARVLVVLLFLAASSTAMAATKAIKFGTLVDGTGGSSRTPSSLLKTTTCKASQAAMRRYRAVPRLSIFPDTRAFRA
jgi:hypothetical protein